MDFGQTPVRLDPNRAFWRSVIAQNFQLPDNFLLASATIDLAGYLDAPDQNYETSLAMSGAKMHALPVH